MGEKPAAGKSRGLQCHTLNSSDISDTKEEICFMSLSTLLSLPVFSRVVMARVAILRLESVMRFSRSRLQAVTADGCFMATCKECNSKSYGSNNILQFKAFDGARIKACIFFKHCSVPQGLQQNLHHMTAGSFVSAFKFISLSYSSWVWQSNCCCYGVQLWNHNVTSFTHILVTLFAVLNIQDSASLQLKAHKLSNCSLLQPHGPEMSKHSWVQRFLSHQEIWHGKASSPTWSTTKYSNHKSSCSTSGNTPLGTEAWLPLMLRDLCLFKRFWKHSLY